MLRTTIAALALAVALAAPSWAGEAPRLAPESLLESLAAADHDVVVLDVRTGAEFAEGHVPGALNIPHDELEARLGELGADRDREVVVYCRSGRRADLALDLLEKAGFRRLSHLDGDFQGWVAADRPVEKQTAAGGP
jgi:rhodanese-related sulfurtransferase